MRRKVLGARDRYEIRFIKGAYHNSGQDTLHIFFTNGASSILKLKSNSGEPNFYFRTLVVCRIQGQLLVGMAEIAKLSEFGEPKITDNSVKVGDWVAPDSNEAIYDARDTDERNEMKALR